MVRIVVTASLGISLLLNGCASQIVAWKARPAAQHSMDAEEFWTITGERRLVFLLDRQPDKPGDLKLRAYCLESLPEAAMAISATSKPAIPIAAGQTFTNDESVTTTLTKTAERTEITEILRQMTFANCMAYGMNVFNRAEYKAQVMALTAAAIAVMKTRAAQPAGAATATKSDAAKKVEDEAKKKDDVKKAAAGGS